MAFINNLMHGCLSTVMVKVKIKKSTAVLNMESCGIPKDKKSGVKTLTISLTYCDFSTVIASHCVANISKKMTIK